MPAPDTGGGKGWSRIIFRLEFMSGLQLELGLPLKGGGREEWGQAWGAGEAWGKERAFVLPGSLWGSRALC